MAVRTVELLADPERDVDDAAEQRAAGIEIHNGVMVSRHLSNASSQRTIEMAPSWTTYSSVADPPTRRSGVFSPSSATGSMRTLAVGSRERC